MRKSCHKCAAFKTRQGIGTVGECRFNPPVYDNRLTCPWPEVERSDWCMQFTLDRDRYDQDGRKIYTRKETRMIQSKAQLAAKSGNPDWDTVPESLGWPNGG